MKTNLHHDEQRIHELFTADLLGETNPSERMEVHALCQRYPARKQQYEELEQTIGLVRSALAGLAGNGAGLSLERRAELLAAAVNPGSPSRWSGVLEPSFPVAAVAASLAGITLIGLYALRSLTRGERLERSLLLAEAEPGIGGMRTAERDQAPVLQDRLANKPAGAPVKLSELGEDAQRTASLELGGLPATAPSQAGWVSADGSPALVEAAPQELPFLGLVTSGEPFSSEAPSAASKDKGRLYKGPGDSVAPGVLPTPASLKGGLELFAKKLPASEYERAPGSPGVSGESVGAQVAGGGGRQEVLQGGELNLLRGLGYAEPSESLATVSAGLLGATDEEDRDSTDFYLGLGLDTRGASEARKQWNIDEYLALCRPLPGETPSAMFFRFYGDNPFVLSAADKLSTFASDVDTASYTLVRNYLLRGTLPPSAAVRTEEFVNYFRPDVQAPVKGDFALALELAPSAFAPRDGDYWLVRATVRAREVAKTERKPLALTFVVDVSNSMRQEGRLELVKHALRLLAGELSTGDSITLVSFSSEAKVVLPATPATRRADIESAIQALDFEGGTNAEAGLLLGYVQAQANLNSQASNRIVLLSDGVANIGQTDQDQITASVEQARKQGIQLNTVGVGMGNHNDVFLEQLADKGDGQCNYVDSPAEARRALVENFTSAFEPIARDVKAQLEFDPEQVESWRQLGYENRAVADQDFRNDAIDAGEINSGHQVTVLYEIKRTGVESAETPLATLRLRWLPPHPAGVAAGKLPEATEISRALTAREGNGSFLGTTKGFRRTAIVAQFAEIMRQSVHARGETLDAVIAQAESLQPELKDSDFDEFVVLVKQARSLMAQQVSEPTALQQQAELLFQNNYLLTQLESLQREQDAALLENLRKQNLELEQQLRQLLQSRK